MTARHKIDIGEAIGLIGSVFRLVSDVKAKVQAARANGDVSPEETIAIVKAAIDEAADGLATQIVKALED